MAAFAIKPFGAMFNVKFSCLKFVAGFVHPQDTPFNLQLYLYLLPL